MKHNVDELRRIIQDRRTVAVPNMNSEKIDTAIINDILAAANWAPTHAYTEPWRFFIVDGASRLELGDLLSKLYKTESPAASFKEEQYQKLKKLPSKAAVVIGIGLKRNESIPEVEEIAAVAAAVQNMHLMTSAYGLGGKWSSPKVVYHPKVKDFFNLTEKDSFLGFFFIGKTTAEWPKAYRNSSIEEKITRLS